MISDRHISLGWGDLSGDRGKEYPFVEDTLGKKLKAGTGLSVSCLTCKRMAVLDMAEMVKRLGPDHSAMHWGLIKVVYCHECRAAGRDDRNLQFTNHAMTPEMRKDWTPCP